MDTEKHKKLLHKELSYQIQGAAMEVRKSFGPGHKESIYQSAFSEELTSMGIKFEREVSIKVYSPKTGKLVGIYRPDFLVENKVVVETKAVRKIPKEFLDQLYDYLRNSEYELGYFINFSSPKLYIKRIIYTNDRKFSIKTLNTTNIRRIATKFSCLLVFLFVFFSVFAPLANGARVFFEPAGGQYEVGDSVNISVLLDTEGASINAVDLEVRVPQLLRIGSVSKNGSVIQLWVQEPSFSDNTVSLVGGVPGGSSGSRLIIGKIITQASAVGEGGLGFLPNSSVLLNDGQGTQLTLSSVSGGVFKIVPKTKAEEPPAATVEPTKEESTPLPPEEKLEEKVEITDKKRPQKFDILFGSDPRVFDGQNFISFFSTDKDSGVDHYEVKEGKGDYKIAQSPYLLDDQELKTVIRVRSYDGAGNYRESVYPNIFVRVWWKVLDIFSWFL